MHWGGGWQEDYSGGMFSIEPDSEPEEVPLILDPVIVEGNTPESSPPISEDNPGCNVHINTVFAHVVETCIDKNGIVTQQVTPYDPEIPDPGLLMDL